MSDVEVVAIGEALLRISPTGSGRLAEAVSLRADVAGAELNVALDLAALGVATRWVSALPRSPLGERVARELRAAGVLTDAIAWSDDARLGLFFVDPAAGPRSADVWYDRAGSAFARDARSEPWQLTGARFVVLSGLTLALGPVPVRAVDDLVRAARSDGVRLCVDVNHRRRLGSAATARAALLPLLTEADVVVCSSQDAAEVFDLTGTPKSQIAALRKEICPSASLVVLTIGEGGALATALGGDIVVQDAVPTTVVDPFGAGDAFVAGLLWALLRQRDTDEALRAAVTLAAVKLATPGDHLAVTEAELDGLLAAGPDRGVRR